MQKKLRNATALFLLLVPAFSAVPTALGRFGGVGVCNCSICVAADFSLHAIIKPILMKRARCKMQIFTFCNALMLTCLQPSLCFELI